MKNSFLPTVAIAAVGFLSPQAASAQAKAPVTHEALWMMKRVGAPIVSPDGKWVLFSVNEPSYEPDKAVIDLWLVPAAGGSPPRRITNTKAAEGGPVWSPDSRSIAFTAKREGDDADQVYILDIAAGGEARRVTTVSTGASNPQWRPDGKAILFESSVYPGALDDEANKKIVAERKARKYNVRAYDHFPIRYWNDWLDERQPTIEVQSLEPGSKPVDILSGSKLARTPGFSGSAGETSFSLSPIWSPDGKEVVFTATAERWNAAFSQVGFQLFRVPAEGGEATPATTAKGDYDNAAFSPDGKALYFTYAAQTEAVYDLPKLSKVAWPAGGAPAVVAKDFDREPARFAITPDSKSVYLLTPEAGRGAGFMAASSYRN